MKLLSKEYRVQTKDLINIILAGINIQKKKIRKLLR